MSAAKRLSKAISIKTVNGCPPERFDEFCAFLREAYPNVAAKGEWRRFEGSGILIRVAGEDNTQCICLLAHMDTVDASDEGWAHPPFAGDIAGGAVWGRGAYDMKGQLIAIFEAMEETLGSGLPEYATYICLGFDEEASDNRAVAAAVSMIAGDGIPLRMVIDEGGGIMEGGRLGLDTDAVMVGICEKGYANFEIAYASPGGHSSAPPERTAVGKVCAAVKNIEDNPAPMCGGQVTDMFLKALTEAGARRDGLVDRLLSAPETAAMLRTTCAPTMMGGSDRPNVLCSRAWAVVNVRPLPPETIESAHVRLKALCPGAQVTFLEGNQPIPPSEDGEALNRVTDAARAALPGLAVIPCPTPVGTDSRHFREVCPRIYRVTPFITAKEEAAHMHAADEKLSIRGLETAVEFYRRILTKNELRRTP